MSRRGNAAGFTLLELLVAMTVLAVLTGLLATGVSFGARIWEREQRQLEQWAELQMVQDVVRRTLGEAWPLSVPTDTDTQNPGFIGSRTSIDFLGPPPAQSLVGGVYQYSLFSRAGPEGVSLVLTWGLRDPKGTQRAVKRARIRSKRRDDNVEVKEVILLDQLMGAEFSYFGTSDGDDQAEPRWFDRWQGAKLPLLVRMHVQFPAGDRRRWPDFLVAPAITGSPNEG
jgi:general secretion pathway protein J